jgi:ABC-type sugar transport system substrate-binding protein
MLYRYFSSLSTSIREFGIQALVLASGDPAHLTPVINAEEEKNFRVVCVDTTLQRADLRQWCPSIIEISGKLAAEFISSIVPANSQVAVLTGMLDTDAHGRMTRSFCELYPQLKSGGEVLKIIATTRTRREHFKGI